MATRYFALVYGIVFLLVGIAGFIPGLVTEPVPGVDGAMAHGLLFGLFAVNVLHNLFHAAFGVWGIAAYRSFPQAHTYAIWVAIIYGVLFVLGFIPGLNTLFGLIPLYGHDIWLHAALAIVAAVFAWGIREAREPHAAAH